MERFRNVYVDCIGTLYPFPQSLRGAIIVGTKQIHKEINDNIVIIWLILMAINLTVINFPKLDTATCATYVLSVVMLFQAD